ncbi:MAG: T9SS type A sorting domain-containing protein [Bacteroidia bacterium]|nr:T9SS type A sorting domain-containing protein [Bacteroidia bacterium]
MKRLVTTFLGVLCYFFTLNAQNIVQAEYFFDTDPGVGNGTSLTVSADTAIDETANISLAGLSVGYHYLFVRVQNDMVVWSLYRPHKIYVYDTNYVDLTTTQPQLSNAEYFFDSDPGVGNGAALTVTAGDSVNETANISMTGLSVGYHYLFVRVLDDSAQWSIYRKHKVYVYDTTYTDMTVTQPQIIDAEYFYDTDPGVGNGTGISLTPGDSVDVNTTISTIGLNQGQHDLFIRVKDSNNVWSLYAVRYFYICDTAYNISNSVTICNGESVQVGSSIYTTSGIYIDTLAASDGCDSIITTNLTVNTVDTSITEADNSLTANATGGTYQWLDCDNNFAVITGATNQTYSPTVSGNYTVEITQNGCTDTSTCYIVILLGIPEKSMSSNFKVYPNPSDGIFTIEFQKPWTGDIPYKITDILGKIIRKDVLTEKRITIDLLKSESGVYLLKIYDRTILLVRQ